MSREQDKWDAGEASYKAERDEQPRSYRAEVLTTDGHAWAGNALRFATFLEAEGYGFDLMGRWSLARSIRVVPSEDSPNYEWVNDRLAPMKPGDVI